MKKSIPTFLAGIERIESREIYLNVDALSAGEYTLKIMFKNKKIQETTFKK